MYTVCQSGIGALLRGTVAHLRGVKHFSKALRYACEALLDGPKRLQEPSKSRQRAAQTPSGPRFLIILATIVDMFAKCFKDFGRSLAVQFTFSFGKSLTCLCRTQCGHECLGWTLTKSVRLLLSPGFRPRIANRPRRARDAKIIL